MLTKHMKMPPTFSFNWDTKHSVLILLDGLARNNFSAMYSKRAKPNDIISFGDAQSS